MEARVGSWGSCWGFAFAQKQNLNCKVYMATVEQKRAELEKVQVGKPNKVSKLDAINKYLKKLKTSGPDQKLAANAADFNLQKFTEEIMEVVKVWIQAEENEPVCTATLCYCLYEYQEFPARFVAILNGLLSNGVRLDQASTKLKLMSLVMELQYAGKKMPVGQMFSLINVNIQNYFIAYYYMQGLVYFFGMYPLKSANPKRVIRPEEVAIIRKKLMLVKDISIGIFEKEKEILNRNHKMYGHKLKKGYVLTQQTQQQQNKERELVQLKKCLEAYCGLFEFPCALEYIALEPQKQQIHAEQPAIDVPTLTVYTVKDFQALLPGILFEQELSKDFEKLEKVGQYEIDFIRNLSQKSTFEQVDEMFEEFMAKFTCNKRALILTYIIDKPEYFDLFEKDRLVLLARFIASFCYSWKEFVPELNYRMKQRIDSEWSEYFSEELKKLLMLYAELANFQIADENKFMSVFKNLVEIENNHTAEQFVRSCYKQLLEQQGTKERTTYLLEKSSQYKDLI